MKQVIRIEPGTLQEWIGTTIDRPSSYQGWPVYGQVFVCPACAETWAIIGSPPYQPIGILCELCPTKFSNPILSPIPGSILDNHTFCGSPDWDLVSALPKELLDRELRLHIKAQEIPDECTDFDTSTCTAKVTYTGDSKSPSGSECSP